MNTVFSLPGSRTFSGESDDYVQMAHSEDLALANGTIALTFVADDVSGYSTLVSKDEWGYNESININVQNGVLNVRLQSPDNPHTYLNAFDTPLEEGVTYHAAVTFGENGANLYLNGELVASEPGHKTGLALNTNALVVGATGGRRTDDSQGVRDNFDGTISDVVMIDGQLSSADIIGLAGAVNPAFAEAAEESLADASLLAAFDQLHHGSDEAKAMAMAYGITHEGELTTGADYQAGTDGDDTLSGSAEADAIDGGLSDDVITGEGGNDVLQGGYGNDTLDGGDGNDVIDGGHGEDVLSGGAGDDLLISRSDGREGETAAPTRPDPLNELTDGKLYPDQPIPSDDVLTGGAGADTYYFQTLINAKERYIEKHTQNDGTINWHGVAGENDKQHDHWVDTIGNDVITDFSIADGDRIVIEGHTTVVKSITQGDANNDGILDHSVIELVSNQGGNGGAHANDPLGTITVYGDLITSDNVSATAKPAYGIVKSISDLEEALVPIQVSEDTGDIAPPADIPTAEDLTLPDGLTPVFAMAGSHTFSGERGSYVQMAHSEDMALANGTIALTFVADDVSGYSTLVSKDEWGYNESININVQNGVLNVRMQAPDMPHAYLNAFDTPLEEGVTYHAAVTFGENGVNLYLNGELVDSVTDHKAGLALNTNALVVGATGGRRTDDSQDVRDNFDGTISDVVMIDGQLDDDQVSELFDAATSADASTLSADSFVFAAGVETNLVDVIEETAVATSAEDDAVSSQSASAAPDPALAASATDLGSYSLADEMGL